MTIKEILQEQGYQVSASYTERVERAEQQLAVQFAADYRDLLISFGQFSLGAYDFTGVLLDNELSVVSATQEEREWTHPDTQGMYVIAYLYVDGIVIWQDSQGAVYQTIPDKSLAPERLYSSFVDYVKAEVLI